MITVLCLLLLARPTLSVVGSLEGTYIDNAFFTSGDRRDDVYFNPDVTIRLDGRFDRASNRLIAFMLA